MADEEKVEEGTADDPNEESDSEEQDQSQEGEGEPVKAEAKKKPFVKAKKAATKPTRKADPQAKLRAEREKKVAAEKERIAAEDAKKAADHEKEAKKQRQQVREHRKTAKEQEKVEAKQKEEAKAKKQSTREERRAARKAEADERLAARGKVRCKGSNLDVEENDLTLTSGKLRENPWSKQGKRVRCPNCNRSVGIHVLGRKDTDKKPRGYALNTHYAKLDESGKLRKVTPKGEGGTRRTRRAATADKPLSARAQRRLAREAAKAAEQEGKSTARRTKTATTKAPRGNRRQKAQREMAVKRTGKPTPTKRVSKKTAAE